MHKIIIASVISAVALVGCSQPSSPQPTVTITQEAPAPEVQTESNESQFISYVRANGGFYADEASDSDILSIGRSICRGFEAGLSQDDIIGVLADSLIESGMANEDGTLFAGTLLYAATTYLCGVGA